MSIKNIIISYCGMISSIISYIFGGWNTAMTTLCVFMLIDYITGILCAAVFKKSPKTSNGSISSNAMFVGLIRKVLILMCVLIGARLDILMSTHMLKDGVCTAFIVSELISITENLGIMGVPMPKVIGNVIDVLNKRGDNNESTIHKQNK